MYFTAVISKVESDKVGLTRWVNKIRESVDKSLVEKRKLLVEQLNTQVEELFPYSLDELRGMSSGDQ